jgi:hypothetical protein
MSAASESERLREELFDELLADVNQLVLETNASVATETTPQSSSQAPPAKRVPPPLPAKDKASSASVDKAAVVLVAPASAAELAQDLPTVFKVHCGGSQYTTVKCAQPDATVSDLLSLVKKKRAVGDSGKEGCLVRFGTFEILDPSTRIADLFVQHGHELQFAFDDVESVIAKFAAAAAAPAADGGLLPESPKKAPSVRRDASHGAASASPFGTLSLRSYFSGSSHEHAGPEFATGTKAFHLLGGNEETLLQGWLRKKRKGSKAPWRRRWIVMSNAKLYFYRVPEASCSDVKERSLRFAQVKRGIVDSLSVVGAAAAAASGDDMSHWQFEVMFGSSGEDSGAVFIFEAACDADFQLWSGELAKRCDALMLEAIDATPKSNSAQRLAAHVAEPGNAVCADCGAAPVEWASAKCGVTLCTNCSGAHRALGVHVSTVRSLTLDEWPAALLADFLAFGGNRAVNELLESALPAALAATRDAATRDVVGRERCAAYERGAFAGNKYTSQFVADEKAGEWAARFNGGSPAQNIDERPRV